MNDFEPSEFYLSQNYPNPFREKTTIKYCVAYKTRVRLTVFDEDGNEIEKLVDEEQKAGTYEVVFKSAVSSLQSAIGSYYYRLEAGDYSYKKKMNLEK
jgi:hypothetical protein